MVHGDLIFFFFKLPKGGVREFGGKSCQWLPKPAPLEVGGVRRALSKKKEGLEAIGGEPPALVNSDERRAWPRVA